MKGRHEPDASLIVIEVHTSFFHFIRKMERQERSSTCFVQSLDASNSQGWSKLKPGAPKFNLESCTHMTVTRALQQSPAASQGVGQPEAGIGS